MPPTVGVEGFISRKMKRLVAWQANQFCIAGEGLQCHARQLPQSRLKFEGGEIYMILVDYLCPEI
jgi:hypothetical protein